jgi:hypothetical protein
MISKDLIISKLPPFLNQQNVVVQNQDVKDIINGILYTHNKYAKDYDKISQYFEGHDINETAKNIFNFLKKNIIYRVESENRQMLKSPSSFLSTGVGDCKSLALFINGVLDSLRRKNGDSYQLMYRFASYDAFNKTPQHVFAVVKDGGTEYWVDPVLPNYNQKKQPYYYQDKKIKSMSLISLSGVDNYDEQSVNGVDNYDEAKVDGIYSNVNYQGRQQMSGYSGSSHYSSTGNKMGFAFVPLVSAGVKALPSLLESAKKFLPLLNSLSNNANPNDWKGWDAQDQRAGKPLGSSAGSWVNQDGDSVSNEASNILSYINAYGIEKVLGPNAYTTSNVTFDDVINKLRKGGLYKEADLLIATQKQNPLKKLLDAGSSANKQAGISPFVILALVGAGAYFFTRKKSA